MIRAAEIQFGAAMSDDAPPPWPSAFWQWAHVVSVDDHVRLPRVRPAVDRAPGIARVEQARAAVEQHAAAMTTGSAVDERHDGAFGLALYALDVLRELMEASNGTRIIGRMALRSLAEARITSRTARMRRRDRSAGFGLPK